MAVMTSPSPRMMDETTRVHTGLSAEDRQGVVGLLNKLLADEMLLYVKSRNYHWNVRGMHFQQLHELFEEQYRELEGIIDDVAERARALGGFAIGTVQEFERESRLSETPGEYPRARDMLGNLLADHEAVIRHLREDQEKCTEHFHDVGTNDFMVGLLERHEKMAWMLRTSLADD